MAKFFWTIVCQMGFLVTLLGGIQLYAVWSSTIWEDPSYEATGYWLLGIGAVLSIFGGYRKEAAKR